MDKFQFDENIVKLEIAGNSFTISGTAKYFSTVAEVVASVKKFWNKKTETEENMVQGEIFLRKSIDSLLGDGTSEKILMGRDPDYFDTWSVYSYIIAALTDYKVKRLHTKGINYNQA